MAGSAFAQLKAAFKANTTSGCAPMIVRFTDESTGNPTGWTWDLGNGTTSTQQNPSASYPAAGVYTIKLTVNNAGGSATEVKTGYVIVRKNPVADFAFDTDKGCVPMGVKFTDRSTAGEGTLSNYAWDFGDGVTGSGSAVSHVFNYVQSYTVSLTVTNSYGCTNAKKMDNIITASPALVADFTVPNDYYCAAPATVPFTNKSSTGADVKYAWAFGDNTTGTELLPSHVYQAKGAYTTKLTVTNSIGCKAEKTAPTPLNVANFSADFNLPATICQNSYADIPGVFNPAPTDVTWLVDDNLYDYGATLYPGYMTVGKHKVTLKAMFGTCEAKVDKNIDVKPLPVPDFEIERKPYCTLPITIKMTDKSTSAVKWAWESGTGETSTDKDPAFTYRTANYFTVSLKVTSADGCASDPLYRYISISEPKVEITAAAMDGQRCEGTLVSFYSYSVTSDVVDKFEWDFGDGTPVSTEANPVHTYAKEGTYYAKLKYTTQNGCTGTATTVAPVNIYKKPVADFSSPPTVCGNNPANFTDLSTGGTSSVWVWGDNSNQSGNTGGARDQTHAFIDGPGDFTVRLTVYNNTCYTTTQKTIKVLGPYPKFEVWPVDCTDRLRAKITDNTLGATSYKWEYGDGQQETFNGPQANLTHLYNATGNYTVKMTVSDGTCTSTLAKPVRVVAKGKITVVADKAAICRNGEVTLRTTSIDNSLYLNSFYPFAWRYNDNGVYHSNTSGQQTYAGLAPGPARLKLVATNLNACLDTSNEVLVDVRGPVAGFDFPDNRVCKYTSVEFADQSDTKFGTPIQKWIFNYGDNTQPDTLTQKPFRHMYTAPGYYTVSMKVIDQEGCYDTYYDYAHYVRIDGPDLSFSMPALEAPGNIVYLYNYSGGVPSTAGTQYKWDFGDGTTSTDVHPTKRYDNKGVYTVELTAVDSYGCKDTLAKKIKISNVSAGFNYTSSYVNPGSGCPPVSVTFNNTSVNYSTALWDFGDNSVSRIPSPSHVYTEPGLYTITLIVEGDANTTDTITDQVEIKGPYGKIKASGYGGCLTKEIQFTAESNNVTNYAWDFTDGQVTETTDKTIDHTFKNPGVYTPRLILSDGSGCKGTAYLDSVIVIDQINLKIAASPATLCDYGKFDLSAVSNSYSVDQGQAPVVLAWTAPAALQMTGENTLSPVVYAAQPGSWDVSLHMVTVYGCEQTVTQQLKVLPKPVVNITGPAEVCAEAAVTYTAALTNASTARWAWDFDNGKTTTDQLPAAQQYTAAGSHEVRLIAESDNGCKDTAYHTIVVNALPVVNARASAGTICLGGSVSLSAEGGSIYDWSPAASLNNSAIATPMASPEYSTTYKVKVVNAKGCERNDEVDVKVIRPLELALSPVSNICLGDAIALEATGADVYDWTGENLSDLHIANPVARPAALGTYTYSVTGSDKEGCFSRTKELKVAVQPAPTVNAGADVSTPGGTPVVLMPMTSSDVVRWNWQPAIYVDCYDCPRPKVLPNRSTVYTLTVSNVYGCTASDDVKVQLVCNKGAVFIPSAFTPNNDGQNDRFVPLGSGIREVRSMRIYNRWGNLVFEQSGFQLNDHTKGWDGMFQGKLLPAGSYLYFIEAECEEKTIFEFKGSLTLVR